MEEMKPGRELDALVAEKVMGWAPEYPGGWLHPPRNHPNRKKYLDHDGCSVLQPYSTDIAAAWEVVEKIEYNLELIEDEEWIASFFGVRAFGKSAPHAICLAALKTKSDEFWKIVKDGMITNDKISR